MSRLSFLPRGLAFLLLMPGLATLSSIAQTDPTAELKIPDGPLLRPAPEYSQWVVTYVYPEDHPKKIDAAAPGKPSQANPLLPRTVVTTKTADMIREDSTDVAGRATERWSVGQVEYRRLPNDPIWYEDRVEFNGAFFKPFPANGFRDFDGVSKDSFIGDIKYQNRDCLIFMPGAPQGTKISQEADLNSVDNVLIVDAQTRLPVEARARGVVWTFAFGTPPGDKLTLPADLQAQLAKAEQNRRILLARPERPY